MSELKVVYADDAQKAAYDAVQSLLTYVSALLARLDQLGALAGAKLAAMRTANAGELQRLAVAEGELLRDVLAEQQQRGAVLAEGARFLPGGARGAETLTGIAERLGEPEGSVLRAKNAALRVAARELQRKNAVVASVARNLQGHIRDVFAELARATQESVGYGSRGRPQAGSRRCWVDAVG